MYAFPVHRLPFDSLTSMYLKDAFLANQNIVVWPMTTEDSPLFDEVKFFRNALEQEGNRVTSTSIPFQKTVNRQIQEDDDKAIYHPLKNYVCWDESDASEALEDIVRKRDIRKRRLTPVVLDFGNKLKIGLEVFSPLILATIPHPQKLDARTQQVVRTDTSLLCSDTGRTLAPEDVAHFFQYGNHSRVFMTNEELRSIRNFKDPATFKLVGFKPQSSIKVSSL